MIPFVDLKSQYKIVKESVNQRIADVLEHGKFILGPEVVELETRLANFVNSENCIGVSSGTDALLVAMMALDLKPGDEVIVPAFSYIATAETVALLGGKLVYVDVKEDTFNLDPSLLEAAITKKTKAIVPVSLYGQCADFVEICKIAELHRIPVIEDAAQSLGATHHNRMSCSLTDIGVTSFFPSKPLGAYGDAGAVFTQDDDLAHRIQMISRHGQKKRYFHTLVGVNARIDTLQAAILLAKLDIFEEEILQRREVAKKYDALIREMVPSVDPPLIEGENTSVYAQYTIKVPNRDKVQEYLNSKQIPTAVHYPLPLYKQPAIQDESYSLPITEKLSNEVLSIPMHPYLDEDQQQLIITELRNALEAK